MRILHAIWSLDPRSGGPGHAIRKIAAHQVRQGHQVAIAATTIQVAESRHPAAAFKAAILTDPELQGVEVFLANALGCRKPWSSWAYSLESRGWLRDRMADKTLAPEVVHIHGLFSHIGTAAAAQARRHAVPYFVRPAGMLNPTCFQMGSRRLKSLFMRLFLRNDLRQAHFINVTSASEADAVAKWLPAAKLRIIPHGVVVPAAVDVHAKREFLDRFPQLGGKKVVLSVARIAPKKRPEVLVEAVARLRGARPDLVLVLAGSDEGHLATVQVLAKRLAVDNALICTGFLNDRGKAGAFAAADVFALPSLDENFAVAVIEAMAHAVPVLVTPEVAAHAYVDESGGGLTVAGSAEAFAAGIEAVLARDPRADGSRGRRYVEKNLSWDAVIEQIDAMYRDAQNPMRAARRTAPTRRERQSA